MIWKKLGLSKDAQILLDTLVERKQKKENLLKTLKLANLLLGGCIILFCFIIFRFTLAPSNNDAMRVVELFTNNMTNVLLIIILVSVKMWVGNVSKKYKEAKKKFDDLREECVDYLDTTWLKSDISKIKDQLSHEMKEKYGINITHKS